ncbi:hypothetical protein BDP27DRAFT_1427353 [Rhodocollybia butyracea]|uniref:Uncharacterized protein n=1 Tax=Rhodocollybia butyracea TaxID=206335 RepID=A0A9P5PGP7_9AGAR|nr:hypothetical protein BDP27DRAFT_1427353 [Rhodocollybia butyracea]
MSFSSYFPRLMHFKMFGSKTSNVIYEFSSPIPSIEANSVGNQLLVCSSRAVNVLTEAEDDFLDHSWSLRRRIDSMSSIGEPANFEEPPVIATGAYYLQDESQCAVSYLCHGLWKVDLETGESEWNWGPDQRIGTSTISPDRRSLATANICTGIDWFDLSGVLWTKISTTMERQELQSNVPMPVKFINQGNAVAMGTTKGYAIIFHAEHGKQLQTLDHANHKAWITSSVSN